MTISRDHIAGDVIVGVDAIRKEKIIGSYSRISQFLAWPILAALFYLFFKIKINGAKNVRDAKGPFIIIANHFSFYDSFLLRIVLGPITNHLPLRFMAVRKFKWKFLNLLSSIGIIDLVYFLFGVFVIQPGRGVVRNLKEAILILEAGENVVMYPEGQINRTREIANFKIGTAVLARKSHAPIVPIAFKKIEGRIRGGILINVGEQIRLSESDSDKNNTLLLQNAIKRLYGKL